MDRILSNREQAAARRLLTQRILVHTIATKMPESDSNLQNFSKHKCNINVMTVERSTYGLTTRQYLAAIRLHRKTALLALLSPLGAVFMSVLVPYCAGRVFAGIATRNQSLATHYLVYLAISAAIGVFFNRIGFVSLMRLIAKVMSDQQAKVLNHLLYRSTGFHSNQVSGKLVTDAVNYIGAFNTLIGAIVVNGLPFFLIVLTGLGIVFITSWLMGLYLLAVVIITIIWAILESRTRAALRVTRLEATRALTAHLSDTIVNATTVKTFAREQFEIVQNRRLAHKLRDLRIKDWSRSGISGSNRLGALLLMQIILLAFLTRVSTSGTTTIATGIFAFTYVFTITTRLFQINDMLREVEEAYLQASPVSLILSEEAEIKDSPGAKDLRIASAGIKFENVHFHYEDSTSGQEVFAGLNLEIQPGERIGVIGPSGGGKSTLTRLLLRFEDIDSGTISIDGQDISNVTQTSLRRAISYVPQEPLLFHRTICQNIAYGRDDATESQVRSATEKAHADGFISELPKGYDTVVGERGVKLSGGQRQRVAIARAILKNAPILILDEATSSLDSESEVMIQEALWALMKDRTAIVIAHRLSTIAKMDRIIVIDRGEIAEQGTHRELLDLDGLYARLWHHQSGGFIEE